MESTFDGSARRLAEVLGCIVVAVGVAVLVGWSIDSTLLTRVAPGLPSMKALTAVALIALGAAAALLAGPAPRGGRHTAGVACAALATLIGAAALVEHLVGGLGIDELLVDDPSDDRGRPSEHTALSVLLCGLALVGIDRDPPRYTTPLVVELLAAGVVLAALAGFAYDVDYVHGRTGGAGFALHTALAMLLVVIATALARPDRGVVDFLRGDDPASELARRLVAIAIAVPLALGAVRLVGEEAGWFSAEVGLALVTLGAMVALLAVAVLAARDVRSQSARGDFGATSFRAVSEAALEAIVVADERGTITYFNPAAERMFGYAAAEVAGAELTMLMPARFRRRHQAGLERFLATGEARVIGRTVELVGLRRDGEEFPLSLSLADWAVDGRRFFTGTIRDVSEQKEAERALAAERRQLADAQQIASVGSWGLDLAAGTRTWSAQQFRNYGFDPGGPLPGVEEVLDRIHPDDLPKVRRQLAKIEAGEHEFAYGYRVILPDGRVREIETAGRPFVDADGVTRVMGTSRDVTPERDAERVKDEFFGLVSHELRTPLTSIIGYLELLIEIESAHLTPTGRRFLEVIERNSRRELSLVSDLLLLTRITAGTFEIEVGQADLGDMVSASVEAAAPDAASAGIEVVVELADAPVIEGDPQRLGQVIENLLSNAIKFTPRGGTVVIRAARKGGEPAVLTVSDTGIGIPAEDREHLFERMFRAREAERRHIQGTGLGLTIVEAIVNAHGGSVSVRSEVGAGTTFTVELPVRAGGPDASETPPDRDAVGPLG